MPLIRQQGLIMAAVIFFTLIAVTSNAIAKDVTPVTVAASSLVPGQEARYTVKFRTDTALDLSKGASVTVALPSGFMIMQNDILAENPGCALARIEYKNPGDRFYAVIRGTVSVEKNKDGVQCRFIPQMERLTISADTDLYLSVPGIINAPAIGPNTLKLFIHDALGEDFYGAGAFALGVPPTDAPQHVKLAAASSSKVELAWEPVSEATRYRVVFSSQPDGQFISALDLGREPSPGEDWQLTETTHSFTGRVNGGLSPGGTYYFKVQAGNAYGYGPGSALLRVTVPEIKLLNSGSRKAATVSLGESFSVTVDQSVKIVNDDGIRVYEKGSGVRVKQVCAEVEDPNHNVIRINAALQPGKEYMVVVYEGVLESRVQPGVINKNFSWTVVAAAKKKGA